MIQDDEESCISFFPSASCIRKPIICMRSLSLLQETEMGPETRYNGSEDRIDTVETALPSTRSEFWRTSVTDPAARSHQPLKGDPRASAPGPPFSLSLLSSILTSVLVSHNLRPADHRNSRFRDNVDTFLSSHSILFPWFSPSIPRSLDNSLIRDHVQ